MGNFCKALLLKMKTIWEEFWRDLDSNFQWEVNKVHKLKFYRKFSFESDFVAATCLCIFTLSAQLSCPTCDLTINSRIPSSFSCRKMHARTFFPDKSLSAGGTTLRSAVSRSLGRRGIEVSGSPVPMMRF